MNGLEDEFAGKAAVVRLNAADPAVVAFQQEVGVRGHPAFVILDKQNQILERFVGPQELGTLQEGLKTAAEQP